MFQRDRNDGPRFQHSVPAPIAVLEHRRPIAKIFAAVLFSLAVAVVFTLLDRPRAPKKTANHQPANQGQELARLEEAPRVPPLGSPQSPLEQPPALSAAPTPLPPALEAVPEPPEIVAYLCARPEVGGVNTYRNRVIHFDLNEGYKASARRR